MKYLRKQRNLYVNFFILNMNYQNLFLYLKQNIQYICQIKVIFPLDQQL